MTPTWTRRDVLLTLTAAAGAPLLAGARPARRVGIVGGGMAGVALAWLLDGYRDVVLIEARDGLGGNVRSVEVDLDGHRFPVDIGAQFFHPGPYPLYTALLTHLGLYPAETGQSHPFPASITVTASGESTPRFVSPVLPDRSWPILAAWNQAGLSAFATAFAAAKLREQLDGNWLLTLDDWLPKLGLPRSSWEGILLPWAASLFSGSIDQARGLSARAAMIFAAKAVPDNALDPVVYYVLNHGMAEALRRMIEQCTTVQVLTGTPVDFIARMPDGGFRIQCASGQSLTVDDLALASSGPETLRLLDGLPGTEAQRAAVAGIEFHDAELALHTDPIYVPPNPFLWSFLNCHAQGAACEASMWLLDVVSGPPRATAAKLWKSWITHRQQQPANVLHQARFKHMLPTPATLVAQSVLRHLQGSGGVWFAGGYTFPFDSQETALLSALGVARGLNAATWRAEVLAAEG